MIIAIQLKTESGDSYMFHKEVDSEEDMMDCIQSSMGSELEYVCEHEVSVLGQCSSVMSEMLQSEIESMWGEH